MKKSLLIALGLAFSLSAVSPVALSHGSTEPEHGGVVKVEHELVFELVRESDGVSLYIKDHGEAFATDDLTGSVIVLGAGKKEESVLSPAGGNKMTAPVVIEDGAKVLLRVQSGDHHAVTVRYSF
ncbi:hypothetical protein [Lacimicrobium alkaliphilum]|uniref:Uncharacterized protein n=1 Tax=Lacimicrobium alkaliphilum TaxID=1526571 RepID=A0ABQ1R770_9ALTE|nr:hypothetical protein [Lacimicrobium alkaliphilum]GGD60857.1 hypothetical protein GCM10011357_15220 [Lacimicrobium alkaliphilum]